MQAIQARGIDRRSPGLLVSTLLVDRLLFHEQCRRREPDAEFGPNGGLTRVHSLPYIVSRVA
jgi:hypothetical protein